MGQGEALPPWPLTFAACLERVSGLSFEPLEKPASQIDRPSHQPTGADPSCAKQGHLGSARPAAGSGSGGGEDQEDVGVPITVTPAAKAKPAHSTRVEPPKTKRPAPPSAAADGVEGRPRKKTAPNPPSHSAVAAAKVQVRAGLAKQAVHQGDAAIRHKAIGPAPTDSVVPANPGTSTKTGAGAVGISKDAEARAAARPKSAIHQGLARPKPVNSLTAAPALARPAAKGEKNVGKGPAAPAPAPENRKKSLFSELLPTAEDW